MNVTLPLSNKDLLQHLSTKDIDPVTFIIDYENSAIKGNGFLSFIVNADLSFKIPKMNDELFIEYLHMNNIFSKPNQFTLIHANLIMYIISEQKSCFAYDPTHYDFTVFLKNESVMALVNEHIKLLSSVPAFIVNNIITQNQDVDDELESYDFNSVGKTWVNLLQIPRFLDIFLSVFLLNNNKSFPPPSNFNDYIFKGRNLIDFIPMSSYAVVTSSLFANEHITVAE